MTTRQGYSAFRAAQVAACLPVEEAEELDTLEAKRHRTVEDEARIQSLRCRAGELYRRRREEPAPDAENDLVAYAAVIGRQMRAAGR